MGQVLGVPSGSAGALSSALVQQESTEQALHQLLAKERLSLLQATTHEAKRMVQDALARMEDPAHISCTGSAGDAPAAPKPGVIPPCLLPVILAELCMLSACRLPPVPDPGSLRVCRAAAGCTQQVPFGWCR